MTEVNPLYGVLTQSLVFFHDNIKPLTDKYEVSLRVLESKGETPDARIYIVPNFRTFVHHAKNLEDRRVAVFIFDNPFILKELKGLTFFDEDQNIGLSYVLKFRDIDMRALKEIVRKASEKDLPKLKVETTQFEVLPQLIKQAQEGRFLDKYNTLVFRSTNKDTRNKIRLYFFQYLFEDRTLDWLEEKLYKSYRRGEGRDYAERAIKYLRSSDGESLKKATQKIAKKVLKGKEAKEEGKSNVAIPYEKIAKRYGVDRYELRYLVTTWRAATKEDSFVPGNIDSVAYQQAQNEASGEAETVDLV